MRKMRDRKEKWMIDKGKGKREREGRRKQKRANEREEGEIRGIDIRDSIPE